MCCNSEKLSLFGKEKGAGLTDVKSSDAAVGQTLKTNLVGPDLGGALSDEMVPFYCLYTDANGNTTDKGFSGEIDTKDVPNMSKWKGVKCYVLYA